MTTRIRAAILVACLATLAGACADSASARLEADNPIRPVAAAPFGMEGFVASAGATADPARVRLGRWLFYDTRLSADRTVSCATCHRPDYAFSEPTPIAIGVGGARGKRRTPSLINLAGRTVLTPADDPGPMFFWDGRATSLEAQVVMPIADRAEMALDHADMVARLADIPGYRPYFTQTFGTADVTTARVASALADYVRTRVSGNAPFDRGAYGGDGRALSLSAQRGRDLFAFKGRCALCHAGPNFSDGRFYNVGIGWNAATQQFADVGRMAVSHLPRDHGAFKVPGLRDVARRPPYMHDGSIPTLREVVNLYNRGGIPNPWLSQRLGPLGLSETEVNDLVAFLQSLSGEGYEDRAPTLFPK
ncbi:MAG: cytochrome-c peroxidase [Acidobacteria bacterium]|nr:cytochrome-c peroxidase [Acidobacteriota bacterium]